MIIIELEDEGLVLKIAFQVLSCNLYGIISSIVPAKYPGNRRHSLLVAVGEAQLAVVDYDPSSHCFKTRMLYNYEQDDQRQMFLQQTFLPQVSELKTFVAFNH